MLRSLHRLYRFVRVGAPRFLIMNEVRIFTRKAIRLQLI